MDSHNFFAMRACRAVCVSIVMLILAVACSNSGEVKTYEVAGDENPAELGAELAMRFSPWESAGIVVAWLEKAPVDRREFVAKLSAAIGEGYGSDYSTVFFSALDSMAMELPVERSAKVFASASIPERLAERIVNDNDIANSEAFARYVAKAYEADSALARRFRDAYKFHLMKLQSKQYEDS